MTLEDFCSKSRQKVSLAKSKVFFSKNVRDGIAENISNDPGIDHKI